MDKTDLGDRMKKYEKIEAGRIFIPRVPIVVRLDGKCFSSYTRDFEKPYDIRMINLMRAVTEYLIEQTNARVGYTCSDEISLILYTTGLSEPIFGGKVHKITSVLASMCSAKFNQLAPNHDIDNSVLALFDCRAWNVPNTTEAVNAILWRELDCTKNSISSLARWYFSHKELQNLNTTQMQEKLFQERDVNWNDQPMFFKRGVYLQRKKFTRKITPEEIKMIPEKHRTTDEVTRHETRRLHMPPLTKVTNRVDVLIDGAEPVWEKENGT